MLGMYLLILSTLKRDMLLDTHDLDMVEVLRRAPYNSPHRINFALLNNPALRLGHDTSRGPFWNGAPLQDKPRRKERPGRGKLAGNYVARRHMRRIGVRIAQEESQRHNGPGIAAVFV